MESTVTDVAAASAVSDANPGGTTTTVTTAVCDSRATGEGVAEVDDAGREDAVAEGCQLDTVALDRLSLAAPGQTDSTVVSREARLELSPEPPAGGDTTDRREEHQINLEEHVHNSTVEVLRESNARAEEREHDDVQRREESPLSEDDQVWPAEADGLTSTVSQNGHATTECKFEAGATNGFGVFSCPARAQLMRGFV